MKRGLLFFVFFASVLNKLWAQAAILGFNNPHLTQSVVVNPAFIPQFGVSVGASTSAAAYYPNFNLADFFSKSVSIQQGLDSFLKRGNKQLTNIEVENRLNLLNIGIRSRRAYVSMNTAIVTNLFLNIDKDLLGLAYYGNDESSPYFGKRMDLDFQGNSGTVVWENRFTYGRVINKWLNLGIVLTNYNGLYRFDVKSANFGLFTDTSNDHIYKLKADGNWDIQTNGIRNLNPVLPMDYANVGPFFNMGQSAGFGVIVRPNAKLRISGSMNNYGSITWNYATYNHTMAQKSWYFQGLDTTSWAKGNGEQIANNLNDSISKYVNYQSSQDYRWAYNFPFVPTYHLGLEYFFTPKNRISFQYSKGNGVKKNHDFWAFQTQNRIGEHVDLMVSYAEYDLKNKQNLIGMGLSAYWKHYQLYLMANNLKGLMQLDQSHYHSIDVGVNLIFTENIDSDGDGVPNHKDNCKDLYGNFKYRGCPDFISSTPYLYDPNYRKLKKMEEYDDRFENDNRRKRRNRWQF